MHLVFFFLYLFTSTPEIFAQSVIDDLEATETSIENSMLDLPIETITKISQSKRIFIISNSANSFAKGDFISILKNNKLICRAIAAKLVDGTAGIKIVKIYSLNNFTRLRNGEKVQILRGDDSYLNAQKSGKNIQDNTDSFKIKDDDDLFNDTNLDEDINIAENTKRAIKTDNIINLLYTYVPSVDITGASTRYNQISISWSYQIEDNIWAELIYGQSVINDFPNTSLDTSIKNIVIRAKYTIKMPLYSFVQPYVGYQMLLADSPEAGVETKDVTDPKILEKEIQLVDDMKKSQLVFGVSILKRLVPGWFIRADLGTDFYGVGFGLEF